MNIRDNVGVGEKFDDLLPRGRPTDDARWPVRGG